MTDAKHRESFDKARRQALALFGEAVKAKKNGLKRQAKLQTIACMGAVGFMAAQAESVEDGGRAALMEIADHVAKGVDVLVSELIK